jgi:hypothetical protein
MNQPQSPPGPWNTSGWPAPPPPQGWPAPPHPPNYAGAAWNPPPPWPPAAPPKRRGPWRPLLIVGAVLVAVVVVIVVVTQALLPGRKADLTVGQCVSSADYEAYQLRATDCSDVDAVYEYAGKATLDICPDGKRADDGSYFIVIDKNHNEKSCFAANLKEGECYLLDIAAKQVNHAACAQAASKANSHTGGFKVSQRIDGSSDESRCPAGTKAWAFIAPHRVYCLQKMADG